METDINVEIREDHGIYNVYFEGFKLMPGTRDRAIAESQQRWEIANVQVRADIYSHILDKAFKENKEKS